MSEMIDRVAKAVCDAGMAWLVENDPKRMTMTWADIPDEVFARAAIEEIRVPTEAMIAAAMDALISQYDSNRKWEEAKDVIEEIDVAAIFMAMIDAALK